MTTITNTVQIQWVAQPVGDGSLETAFFVGDACVHTIEEAASAVFAEMKDVRTNAVDVFGEVGEYYTLSAVKDAIADRFAKLA